MDKIYKLDLTQVMIKNR